MAEKSCGDSAKTVLVVEDDKHVRELIQLYLEKDGFKTITALDGEEAVDKVAEFRPALVLLDIMLPKMDGLTVCRELRKKYSLPIIMLTAKGEEEDRILGLELGADDYVIKPFSPREVVTRVKAVLRRVIQKEQENTLIVLKDLEIDDDTKEVSVNDSTVSLRPKEYDLLLLFAKHPGRVFGRDELLSFVWGYDYVGDYRTVDTHIKRLRKKLRESGCKEQIKTVWARGYKLEVDF